MGHDDEDRTKLRVRGTPRPAAPTPPAAPPRPPAPPPPPPPGGGGPDPRRGPAEIARPSVAANPLLEAALPLLMLATRIRVVTEVPSVEGLQQRIEAEIQRFEALARDARVAADDVMAARYALCTTLDECVLNTPWGAHSAWAAQTLLIRFHREAFGGEKFFQIVEKISGEPGRYTDLMELMHACLAIGFEGRYRLDARGPARLADIQRDLYERIRAQRGSPPRELSPNWAGVSDPRPRLVRYVPLWIVATATIAIIVLAYLGFRAAIGSAASPVNGALAGIGLEPMYVPGLSQPVGPRLAVLLAPQVQARSLEVSESGNRTLIRLLQPELFASGSATASPSAEPVLRAIAAAVNQVPGRLLVIGHTDDQPVRSIKFADNYELSRARAQAVAAMLGTLLARPGGVEAIGKGAEQPLATPVDRPENRARNRRVEIVHQAGL